MNSSVRSLLVVALGSVFAALVPQVRADLVIHPVTLDGADLADARIVSMFNIETRVGITPPAFKGGKFSIPLADLKARAVTITVTNDISTATLQQIKVKDQEVFVALPESRGELPPEPNVAECACQVCPAYVEPKRCLRFRRR